MWEYSREESKGFGLIPEGAHRIRVKSAEKTKSRNFRDMLALQFEVSGYKSMLYHYIVFLPDKPEITNRMLTQFFDSFPDIAEGDLDTAHWEGKVGACMVKHEEYDGKKSAKVHYFIRKNAQEKLPAWEEPDGGSNPTATSVVVNDGDLPF